MARRWALSVSARRNRRNQPNAIAPPVRRRYGSTASVPITNSQTASLSRQRSMALPAASATRVATRSYTPWKATTKPTPRRPRLASLCSVLSPKLPGLRLCAGTGAVNISSGCLCRMHQSIAGHAAHRSGPELVAPWSVHRRLDCNRRTLTTGPEERLQLRLPTMRRHCGKSPRFPLRVLERVAAAIDCGTLDRCNGHSAARDRTIAIIAWSSENGSLKR